MKRALALALLLFFVALTALSAQDKNKPVTPPKDTADLEQQIRKILSDKKVPGTAVTIVDRNGFVYLAGIGKSDVAANKDVTPDTLFRIGSISKTFVALAALKLESEGKLDLNSPVRSLAPEVKFENQWESTDPVRVINLLEHTTGWDDLHFKEYANSDPKPLTLKEGLDYAPASRTSRWKPGTRFSYCNSGPAVAAYIIEKITGKRFEDYVAENFFQPIGMPTADYLYSPKTQTLITNLYHDDGKTPYPYWHIIMRPAGSINASAREMGNYVRFFLNRGKVNGVQILSADRLGQMETPQTFYGAHAGLRTGYGKHNYTTLDDSGFVWHGHNGGVNGGLSELAYLPDNGIGYFFSINAGNGDAFQKISKLMQAYVTKDLPRPSLPPAVNVPSEVAQQYTGWYQGISPRNQVMYFMERLLGVVHVTFNGDKLTVKPIIGEKRDYVAVTDHLFRRDKQSMATLALMSSDDGLLVQTAGSTSARVSAGMVWTEVILVLLIIVAVVSIVLFALIWIPRVLFGRRLREEKQLTVRILPFMAVLCLAGSVIPFMISQDTFLERFGNPTPYSVSFTILSVAFAVASFLSLFAAVRADRGKMNRAVYWHSLLTSLLLSIATVYLMYWGLIGYRSWM